ncbi:MAG: hypothetical protein VCF25_30780 [Candidatus Poribacteria bacterium]
MSGSGNAYATDALFPATFQNVIAVVATESIFTHWYAEIRKRQERLRYDARNSQQY